MAVKKWTHAAMKEEIQSKIQSSDVFLERALLAIFELQTADEKASAITDHHNDVGFTGVDAGILTNYARFVLDRKAKGVPEGKRLVGGQIPLARKKMMKYHAQLAMIAKAKNPQKYSNPQMSAF